MCDKCKELRKLAKKIEKAINKYESDRPVDADMIKALKAQFYEDAVRILSTDE